MDILSELHWSSKLPLIVLLDFYPLPRSFQKFSWSEWYSSGTVHFGNYFLIQVANDILQVVPSLFHFVYFPFRLFYYLLILSLHFQELLSTFRFISIWFWWIITLSTTKIGSASVSAMFTSSWMCLCSNSWLDCPGIKLTDTSRWLWGIRFLRAYFCYTSTISNQGSRKDKQNTSTYFDFDS